jgi:excisionase family DNA binding protein
VEVSMVAQARRLAASIRRLTPVSAPPEQREDVAALSRLLGGAAHSRKCPAHACKLVGPRGEAIPIPESIFHVFERVAEVLSRGDAITVVPVGKELTTQQAADLLNVSRQYLVRLLEGDKLPYRKTGKHRRLRVEDVLTYRERRDRQRKAKLDELARLSEESGGYSELD